MAFRDFKGCMQDTSIAQLHSHNQEVKQRGTLDSSCEQDVRRWCPELDELEIMEFQAKRHFPWLQSVAGPRALQCWPLGTMVSTSSRT